MLLALLQEETTGIAGAVNDAGDVAEDASREPRSIFKGLGEFLQGTYGYFVSAEFIGDLLASLAVVFLGIVFYRILTHGVPRILRWRRRAGRAPGRGGRIPHQAPGHRDHPYPQRPAVRDLRRSSRWSC